MRTPFEHVTHALELLTEALQPYVEEEMKSVYQTRWIAAARESFRSMRDKNLQGDAIKWDAQTLLTVIWDQWHHVFGRRLGHPERSLVAELRDYRNRWAHQENFDFDDTYRCLDDVARLLKAVGSDLADEVALSRRDLLQAQFTDQENVEQRLVNVQRERRQAIVVYVTCCALIITAILTFLGQSLWYLAVAVVAVFGYMTWQVLAQDTQLIGPRECPRCRRIIYSENCPYC